MRTPRQHGLTMIELMITIVIMGVLLGVAVPSFLSTIARVRLEGVVSELSIDLQYARSAAIRRRAAVTLTTADDGRGYALTLGAENLKTVALPAGVSLSAAVAIVFDPLRGTANAATLDATASLVNAALRVTTSAMGRVQMCSPAGAFGGYSTC